MSYIGRYAHCKCIEMAQVPHTETHHIRRERVPGLLTERKGLYLLMTSKALENCTLSSNALCSDAVSVFLIMLGIKSEHHLISFLLRKV